MDVVLNAFMKDSTSYDDSSMPTAEVPLRDEDEDPRSSSNPNAWAKAVRSLGEAVGRWCQGDVTREDCEKALTLVTLATKLTGKAKDFCHQTDDKAKTAVAGALAVCKEAKDDLTRISGAPPLQFRLFAQTYRSRLSTTLQKVETATAAADEAVFFSKASSKKIGDTADLVAIAKQLDAIATSKMPTAATALKEDDGSYEELVQEAFAIVADEGVSPEKFCKALERTAVSYGCGEKFHSQLAAMQRDESLGDDIAASRANAETDVEDDEEYLRELVTAGGSPIQDVSTVLAQRQAERDEVRRHLAVEQCLHAALRTARVATADGIFVGSAPRTVDLDDDDDDAASDDATVATQVIDDVSLSAWRAEAARLDAETAKLVAETAMIEARHREEHRQLAQSRQLYEAALKSRQEALTKSASVNVVTATIVPTTVEEESPADQWHLKSTKTIGLSDDENDTCDEEESQQKRHSHPRSRSRGSSKRNHIVEITTAGSSAATSSENDTDCEMSPDDSYRHVPREVASVAAELGAVEDLTDVTQRRFDTARRARAAARLADACSVDGPEASAKARNGVTRQMIETLIALLNSHCKQPEFDEFARALGAIAFDCPKNKITMMDAGIIPVVLARVADPHCDHRYVVPLWRTLAAETNKYHSTLKKAAYSSGGEESPTTLSLSSTPPDSSSGASFLAETLCQVISHSYDAEELLLAARTLLSLLKHDSKHHHSFRRFVVDKGGLRGLAHVLDRHLRSADDGDELLTSAKAKTAAAKALMQLLFDAGGVGIGLDIATPEGASAAVDAVRGHVIDTEHHQSGGPPRRSLSDVVADMSSDKKMSDGDLALLALTRALFDVMVAAARRPPQQQNGATSMAFVIRELIVHVAHQSPQLSSRATNVSWVIKEQAAKALRKLMKLSSDADVAAAIKKNGQTTNEMPHPRAERLVQFAVRCDAVPALASVVTDASKSSEMKRAVFAKQEAAHVLRVIAEHSPGTVEAIVKEGVIPALVKFVDVVDKDANKEAAATALWALCKDQQHRGTIVNLPTGLKALMHLVARTGTNAGDEASASLLAAIATDDPGNVAKIQSQADVYPDMVRTVEWNVVYGDTPAVKAAAKRLRAVLGLDDDLVSNSTHDTPASTTGPSIATKQRSTSSATKKVRQRAASLFFFRSKSSFFRKKK